jgi:tubulin monoglycylase TTLL3/8
MVDTNLNVWLLEVNSSPSMEYSSSITERMVKEVLYNLADIANAQLTENGFKTGETNGKFELIYNA